MPSATCNSGRPSYSRAAMLNSSPKEEEVVLLHRRLGHPSFILLKVMYPQLSIEFSMEKTSVRCMSTCLVKEEDIPIHR